MADQYHPGHRHAEALRAGAEAFIETVERAGFRLMFPDEVAVPSEWLATFLIQMQMRVVSPIPETEKARLFDVIRAHVRTLKTRP